MLLRKVGTTKNGKVRYENPEGNVVDLIPRGVKANNPELIDPNFIEIRIDNIEYYMSIHPKVCLGQILQSYNL